MQIQERISHTAKQIKKSPKQKKKLEEKELKVKFAHLYKRKYDKHNQNNNEMDQEINEKHWFQLLISMSTV